MVDTQSTELIFALYIVAILSFLFSYKIEVFSFQDNPRNLAPSYKMELDF